MVKAVWYVTVMRRLVGLVAAIGSASKDRAVARETPQADTPALRSVFGPVCLASLIVLIGGLPAFHVSNANAACLNEALRVENNSTSLPDCRAYEMVSPVDKEGGDILGVPDAQSLSSEFIQPSMDGDALTFTSYRAFGDAVAAPLASQYLSRRGSDRWNSVALNPPREGGGFYGTGQSENEFHAFTPNLCQAWFVQSSLLHVVPAEVDGFPNIVRPDYCGGSTEAYPFEVPALEPASLRFDIEGHSTDGSVVLFAAEAKLTAGAHEGVYQLYEGHDEQLRFVCQFPQGATQAEEEEYPNCFAGMPPPAPGQDFNREATVLNAMSEDGRRVYWTATRAGGEDSEPGLLFVRVNGTTTEKVSQTAVPGPVRYLAATPNGERALFRVEKSIPGEPVAAEGDLYDYDATDEESVRIAGQVDGVVAASADFSSIYFVSEEEIEGQGIEGRPNLYLRREGSGTTLVATLSTKDILQGSQASDTSTWTLGHVAQSTPDGKYLTFISVEPLTGYDNVDSVTGERDLEVFRYDADTKSIDCLSCNPDGSPPDGSEVIFKYGEPQPMAAMLPAGLTQLYAPRSISADGRRVFFTAYSSLLPGDPPGTADVYEWEAVGSGSCTGVSDPAYQSANGGCLYRLSGAGEAEYLDSDATGRDVFFRTAESLIPEDPGSYDIYDARSEGGFPQPQEPAPCSGENCRPSAPPPSFPSAGSSDTRPGNSPRRSCVKGKHLQTKGKVTKCVKKKSAKGKHKKNHKKRGHQGPANQRQKVQKAGGSNR
jgi:hypothetical protein